MNDVTIQNYQCQQSMLSYTWDYNARASKFPIIDTPCYDVDWLSPTTTYPSFATLPLTAMKGAVVQKLSSSTPEYDFLDSSNENLERVYFQVAEFKPPSKAFTNAAALSQMEGARASIDDVSVLTRDRCVTPNDMRAISPGLLACDEEAPCLDCLLRDHCDMVRDALDTLLQNIFQVYTSSTEFTYTIVGKDLSYWRYEILMKHKSCVTASSKKNTVCSPNRVGSPCRAVDRPLDTINRGFPPSELELVDLIAGGTLDLAEEPVGIPTTRKKAVGRDVGGEEDWFWCDISTQTCRDSKIPYLSVSNEEKTIFSNGARDGRHLQEFWYGHRGDHEGIIFKMEDHRGPVRTTRVTTESTTTGINSVDLFVVNTAPAAIEVGDYWQLTEQPQDLFREAQAETTILPVPLTEITDSEIDRLFDVWNFHYVRPPTQDLGCYPSYAPLTAGAESSHYLSSKYCFKFKRPTGRWGCAFTPEHLAPFVRGAQDFADSRNNESNVEVDENRRISSLGTNSSDANMVEYTMHLAMMKHIEDVVAARNTLKPQSLQLYNRHKSYWTQPAHLFNSFDISELLKFDDGVEVLKGNQNCGEDVPEIDYGKLSHSKLYDTAARTYASTVQKRGGSVIPAQHTLIWKGLG
jgi:hypothetical protein